MKLADKAVSPTSRRVKENYMDEGGYGRARTVTVDDGGMTLREHFAGLAMQGLLTNPALSDETADMIAAMAIDAADALINGLENDQ